MIGFVDVSFPRSTRPQLWLTSLAGVASTRVSSRGQSKPSEVSAYVATMTREVGCSRWPPRYGAASTPLCAHPAAMALQCSRRWLSTRTWRAGEKSHTRSTMRRVRSASAASSVMMDVWQMSPRLLVGGGSRKRGQS